MPNDGISKLLLVAILICALVSAGFVTRTEVENALRGSFMVFGIAIAVMVGLALLIRLLASKERQEKRWQVRAERRQAARLERKRVASSMPDKREASRPLLSQLTPKLSKSSTTSTDVRLIVLAAHGVDINAAVARAKAWHGDKDLDAATETLRGRTFAVGKGQYVFVGRVVSDGRTRMIDVSDRSSRLLPADWTPEIIKVLKNSSQYENNSGAI